MKQAYRLGRIVFSVESSNSQFESELSQILDVAHTPATEDAAIIAADSMRSMLNEVIARHEKCIWIDAACLISPKGHRVLISGHSGAGKTTTALALVLGFGWTIISEDIVLIDPGTQKLITFASPFSLKPGAVDILKQAMVNEPTPIVAGEWVPIQRHQLAEECTATFDFGFYFDTASNGVSLSSRSLSPTDYIRAILSCSNLIQKERGPDRFARYVSSANCFRITGGSIMERLNLIQALVAVREPLHPADKILPSLTDADSN